MAILLLIIIVIILLIFLSGQVLESVGEALGAIATMIVAIIKGIIYLIKKLISREKDKKVTVHCPCSNSFQAKPKKKNGWIVECPRCGRKLRVDTSKKKIGKKS